jgi:YHS domain-containing protein
VFRAIAYLIASILLLTVLRAVMGAITRLFASFGSAPPPRQGPGVPNAESLQKDPVCGAYVAPSAAVQKTSGGKTYYFCSAACRDKFG